MGNYIGLKSFLEEVPQQLGYEFHCLNGDNSVFTSVLVRDLSKNFVVAWKIENTLMFSKSISKNISEKLKTLFYNNIWIPNESEVTQQSLDSFVLENLSNDTPELKMLSVLRFVYDRTFFAGEKTNILIKDLSLGEQYWRAMFFHKLSEFDFYISAAAKNGYIDGFNRTKDEYLGVRLTLEGLNQIIQRESEFKSKNCFVAMSFDPELRSVYDLAIAPALIFCGFIPIRIDDDKTISSDRTINDEILAAIKRSKFTIADFTDHKRGVYFEAGYALGRGQKVIYTCREDEIAKAHFDTRNYPHIVWRDAEDLKKKLVDKIEVFIKG